VLKSFVFNPDLCANLKKSQTLRASSAPSEGAGAPALHCNTVKSCFLTRWSYYLRYYENKNGLIVWLRRRRAVLPAGRMVGAS
jgi:hypothetical protein